LVLKKEGGGWRPFDKRQNKKCKNQTGLLKQVFLITRVGKQPLTDAQSQKKKREGGEKTSKGHAA